MKYTKTIPAIAAALFLAALPACDDCETEPNVPDPSVGTVDNPLRPSAGSKSTADDQFDEPPPAADDKEMRRTPPLQEAMRAPKDAVTSQGRFAALMEEGMGGYLPDTGVLFASGGVEEPTVRIVVTDTGTVRWARGKGTYWEKLEETGEATLDEKQQKELADLVSLMWTEEKLTFPPASTNRGELLVVRDGDAARVLEGTYVPREVAPIRDMLMDFVEK